MGQLSAQLCLRQGHHNLGGREMNVLFWNTNPKDLNVYKTSQLSLIYHFVDLLSLNTCRTLVKHLSYNL